MFGKKTPWQLHDLALNTWVADSTRVNKLPNGEKLYRRGDELRIARYLIDWETLIKSVTDQPHRLVQRSTGTPLGVIVGAIPEYRNGANVIKGYWIVENDGKIDIVSGNNDRKPLVCNP
jgi:hypothetical protein